MGSLGWVLVEGGWCLSSQGEQDPGDLETRRLGRWEKGLGGNQPCLYLGLPAPELGRSFLLFKPLSVRFCEG